MAIDVKRWLYRAILRFVYADHPVQLRRALDDRPDDQ